MEHSKCFEFELPRQFTYFFSFEAYALRFQRFRPCQGHQIHDFQIEWQNEWWLKQTNCRLRHTYAAPDMDVALAPLPFTETPKLIWCAAVCVRKMDNELMLIWWIYLFLYLRLPAVSPCPMCLQRRNYGLEQKHWHWYYCCCCCCCRHRA